MPRHLVGIDPSRARLGERILCVSILLRATSHTASQHAHDVICLDLRRHELAWSLPLGNIWWIQTHTGDVDPAEMQRRAADKKNVEAMAYVQTSLEEALGGAGGGGRRGRRGRPARLSSLGLEAR